MNLLIVTIMAQTAFVRADAYVIDAALQPRLRVIVTAVAATLTIGFATVLTIRFGMVGLCLGIVAGRLTQSFAYPHLVRRCFGVTSRPNLWAVGRPLVVMALLFGAAARLGDRILVHHWVAWSGGVVATAAGVLGVALVTGLPAEAQAAVLRRGRELARRLR